MLAKGTVLAAFEIDLPRKSILDQSYSVCKTIKRYTEILTEGLAIYGAGANVARALSIGWDDGDYSQLPRILCMMEVWERGAKPPLVEFVAWEALEDLEQVREPIEAIQTHFTKLGLLTVGKMKPYADTPAPKSSDSLALDALNPRILEVATLIAKGFDDDKRIASELFMSAHTVRGYRGTLKQKINSDSQSAKDIRRRLKEIGFIPREK